MENPKIKTLFEQWQIMANWTSGNIKALSDEDLKKSFAEGKNHGVWILGHLIESEDELSKFLGKGDMLFPEYEDMFGQGSKLKGIEHYPHISLLREQWSKVLDKNREMYSKFSDSELDEPHCIQFDSQLNDFFKTKGRCLMIWILHQMYHTGQLAILVSLAGKSRE